MRLPEQTGASGLQKTTNDDRIPTSDSDFGLAGPSSSMESSAAFPIVGIGASAGGLEAVTLLLRALPVDTGSGFVIIQHLAPDHASNLTEILARSTRMLVSEVRDEPKVEPN